MQKRVNFMKKGFSIISVILCLFSLQAQNYTKQEKEYLDFLYEYMPLNDRLDYDTVFFVKQVRSCIEDKNTFSWCNSIPEDIFKHFVLVYRVNNENLDTARLYMFKELKERVRNLSMYEAALEVNHWCHEKVNYKASDGRTSAPLATMKTSWGRCGEESTFAVTALRSVGIPARQCYTPRWAHTDDNHAWVEVWIDGKWYFLGACEPEAQLNIAWFQAPVKRAMMVHTTVFGKYNGKEEKNFEADKYSKINLLSNYAPTKQLTIKVLDKRNTPIKDAEVSFGLYNYAEYYPIAKMQTNKDGKATLTTGYGDLIIWVKTKDFFAQKQAFANQTEITIILGDNKLKDSEFLITPPKELPIETLTEEQIRENNKRLVYEDSVRNAYIATFPQTEDEILKKSWGNYNEIQKILNHNHPLNRRILQLVYEKDLRDIEANTIIDHLNWINKEENSEYVINPRIALEKITTWRSFINNYFKEPFINGKQVSEWITKNIKLDLENNYYNVPISPKGVLKAKISDKHSREILFVAICRSFGIEARYEWATARAQWREKNNKENFWQYAFNETAEQNNCTLIINNDKRNKIKPEYYSQFTIQRLQNNVFVTLDYEYDPKFASFPETLQLAEGKYRLVAGCRNSKGQVKVKETYFSLEKGKTKKITLTIPTIEQEVESYGKITLPEKKRIIISKYNEKGLKEEFPLQNIQQEKPALVLAVIDPYKEPSRHLLVDISKSKEEFDKQKDVFIVLVLDKSLLNSDFSTSVFPPLPKNTIVILDENKEIEKQIIATAQLEFLNNYPILTLLKKEDIIYLSQGYKISSQEEILKLIGD